MNFNPRMKSRWSCRVDRVVLLLLICIQLAFSYVYLKNPRLLQGDSPSYGMSSLFTSSNYSSVEPVLPLMTVAGPGAEDNLRRFISQVHSIRAACSSAPCLVTPLVLYSVGLPKLFVSEARLWEEVTVFEVSDFIKMRNLSDPDPPLGTPEEWRPYCLKHAVDMLGRVVYMDSSVILNVAFSFAPVSEMLSTMGSLFLRKMSDDPVGAPHDAACDARFQGFVRGSFAYKNILLPQIECAHRQCNTVDYRLLLGVNRQTLATREGDAEAISCQPLFANIFQTPGRQERSECLIRHTEDIIFAAPRPLRPLVNLTLGINITDRKPIVSLGFPATSKSMPPGSPLSDTAFMKYLLPSFANTTSPSDDVHYVLLMGVDEGDTLYDNAANQEKLRALVAEATPGLSVEFHILRFSFSKGWVVYLWNGLFEAAYTMGTDFFLQINDDIVFMDPGWSRGLMTAVQTSRLPYLGVAGPLDVDNQKVLTQAFVSKKHFEIFGFLYPYVFHNWLSDTWMTMAYHKTGTVLRTEFKIRNMNGAGPRYKVCKNQAQLYGSLGQTGPVLFTYINKLRADYADQLPSKKG